MDAVAGGQLSAVADFPQAGAIAADLADCVLTPSTDDDCDDLYGDVNLGFLPLLPLSPSPSSPPKTPSPGLSISFSPSPSPPPRRSQTPELQPEPQPEPQPKPPTPQHQPPLPAPKPPTAQHQPPLPAPKPPSPRHQPALLAPKPPAERHQPPHHRALGASSPTTTALYIADLPWWTTDAEVEAALAPHGALQDLHFFADKFSGRSRGFCRADFLHPSAAASAAAALHGRAFHGYHCVASLSCPPTLHRPGADFDAPAPNPCRGGNAKATARGNVGVLGDGQARLSIAPRPRAFGAMGGGFPSVGQCNAGMGTDMMPSMVAPHLTPAFLAANRMAMSGTGTGVWHNQGVAGGLWGAQHQWNFGGYQMPWQQPRLQQHHHQQYRDGDYGKMSGTGRERPSGRNDDRGSGNVRVNSDRRQFGRGDGERLRQHNRGDGDQRRDHVLEKEREPERNCDESDRRGGEKRRHPVYAEHDDWERRGRATSRSQSRDSDDDDYRRRRR